MIEMLKLELCRKPFIRVGKGQTKQEICRTYGIYVKEDVSEGCLIVDNSDEFFAYEVEVGDTYAALADKFMVDETRLKMVNDNQFLVPSSVILVPKNNLQNAEGG
jgi:hypothetical protein